MIVSAKERLKQLLASIPNAAKVYWRVVDGGGPTLHFAGHNSLENLKNALPGWCVTAERARNESSPGRDVMIFGTFRYWLEHTTALGLTLSGLGHNVTLTYLPYARYKIPASSFDLQRQDAYVWDVLNLTSPLIQVTSLYRYPLFRGALPEQLRLAVDEISLRDFQYSLKVEDVDREGQLYRLRVERNEFAARAALACLKANRPQVVIVPNGSVLEYGVLYHVARYLDIPLVTYEFDEPEHRVRLAQNNEVMREDTDEFWGAQKDRQFTMKERESLKSLLAARQHGNIWKHFSIKFQDVPRQGEEHIRGELGLDARPVVLLAPNVFGDSATLSRQIFTNSLSEWLERTVRYFTNRPDIQLVIRIHPSESRFPYGTSMSEVVEQTLPTLPEHIHLVTAEAPINTYDIMEISDLGLVYTTTVGMEMAMSGVPVIVAGFTHYRGKGFTLDPDSWDAYFELLDRVLAAPAEYRLTEGQTIDAWHYAYRFFFEFTKPFPWHLLYFWDDVKEWPLDRVLGEEGRSLFSKTFQYLTGEPIDWSDRE
ncbi:MAG: hypothetical protein AMJ88_07700 [Anaerolineae bacterium SM23_ 63]|nr:MAG: hypothetical protein AMJ88_07700 [Anaerolineae bacterium SM23_ 63]